ncbi:hypothetical protein AVEN_206302-1 [Araneus ventricosus]|uniref:Uncharacterized protein n=1 Tax=Araneus ventricosus TaxID=182803 RepID=A0A4Y2M5Q6_ARAVE|nr:hypothetical protein AVEN_16238-1 [Araneus ventricosus]GBN21006.1 hypothetical protein AVEN_115421-1 [Araneus ventricosus]GBN21058.1 hypothetical protein AVEN_168387-1 [Araneus ventricosus]GBN21099.1 hypothetical protein AVEN_206302-1 [Araneus ventricosus]
MRLIGIFFLHNSLVFENRNENLNPPPFPPRLRWTAHLRTRLRLSTSLQQIPRRLQSNQNCSSYRVHEKTWAKPLVRRNKEKNISPSIFIKFIDARMKEGGRDCK